MPYQVFGAKDQLEILSLGTELALTEIIGAAGGYWLDTHFDTLPWCLLAGAGIGFALGITHVVSVALAANKKKHGRS